MDQALPSRVASREFTVSVAGASLNVREDGDPARPCVVLLGSLAADTRLWRDQYPALALDHRVACYDYRGHGKSVAKRNAQPMSTLLEDLHAVLDAMNVESATLVGISLGGMIAMEAALRDHKRFPAIIVAAALADMPANLGTGWRQRAEHVKANGVESIVDDTLARWFTPGFARRHPDRWQETRDMISTTTREGYAGCIEAIHDIRLLHRLSLLNSRALFVVGEADSASTPARMQEMAAQVRGSRLSILSGAAHLPNVEKPVAFNAQVAAFLAS